MWTFNFSYMLAGAFTGFFVGLTGVGGGALMTPILVLLFGVSPLTAVGTDLWFAAITKTFGIVAYEKKGHVDWQVVRRLWLGSLPVAAIITFLIVTGQALQKSVSLNVAIGVVIMVTSVGLVFQPKLLSLARSHRIDHPQTFKFWQPFLTVLAGLILGVSVAMTSVGAGALGSVMMLYLYPLRLTPHRLVATDIMHAIPLALLAGAGYLYFDAVDGDMLLNLLLGSVPAILLGSHLSQKISGRLIQLILATMLFLGGLKLIH